MELTIELALQQGVAAHRKGKLQDAERLYRAILQSQPLHPDANHNLGLIAISVNRAEAALPLLKAALKANPKIEQFWLSYIAALIEGKQFENAKKVLKQAKNHAVAVEKLNVLEARIVSINEPESVSRSNPSHAQLSSLLEHYQNEQFGDAEKLAISITQEFPKHQFGWKMLGTVLKITDRIRESLVACQKSVQLAPQDCEAHNSMGVTLQALGRLKEAEASFRQAIALKSDFAEAHSNLGNALQELGRFEEPEASYRQAIALKPGYAEAHSNLGNALKKLGRLEEAAASYWQAIVLKPDYAEVHNSMGITLQELGRLEQAEASFRQAIALKSDFAEAHNNLGNALKELGRLEESAASYWQAIALNPDYVEPHNSVGVTLQGLGRLKEAEDSFRQAIALKHDFAYAHSNLGITLQELGRLEEAKASFEQAIALKSDFSEAHRILASMKKFFSQDEQYSKMQELYNDEYVSEEQRCHVNFGLAKACEDLGNFERAFQHYVEGNVLRKRFLNYTISQDIELFNQLKAGYPRIAEIALNFEKPASVIAPIFIVGMPRSGTTLVEQIISSHSQVTGAGEPAFAEQFGVSIATGSSEIDNDSLLNFRQNYLKKLRSISNGNLIVTDKVPQNFRFLGLLAAALPEAKIVHVKRNPAAVCWANYKQYFISRGLGYSYNVNDTIEYYGLYSDLMDFWSSNLPIRIYNLDYEQLTGNQEVETRKLVSYIGLDWEENLLSPESNQRRVTTASNLQVRKKVYQGSSQKWKTYRPFLNGVLDHLD